MVQNKKENKLNKKEVKMGNKIRGKNGEKYTLKLVRKENIDSKISIDDKFFTKINLKPSQWAYWAGMVDGDGAVQKPYCNFVLNLSDKNIIMELAKMYGCKVKKYTFKNPKRSNMYMVYLGRNKVKHFLFHIYPYLTEKKEQVGNYIKKVYPEFIDKEPEKFGLGYNEVGCKLGYTAGFFDAEGNAGIYKQKSPHHGLQLSVDMTNTNTLPIKKIQSFFLEAPFNFPLEQLPIRIGRKPKKLKSGNMCKKSYCLNFRGKKRYVFMSLMLPYLKCERKILAAKNIMLFAKVAQYTNPKRNNMPNLPVWKNKLELLQDMRSLNQREK
jgi:hypothetical protein